MATCRAAGVRSVWELPDWPTPVVVVVDELAELYLSDGTKEDKAVAARCSTSMLRLAQLGAALGIHLIVAAQRVGADLGPGLTALRAQLGGRICHAVHDSGTADMVLGDRHPEALPVAVAIGADERGVAVTTDDRGDWMRVRSTLVVAASARATAAEWAHLTPELPYLT
jgi:DNA segregation ATPase FtsK/SpoIIIE, S-DNA-T family